MQELHHSVDMIDFTKAIAPKVGNPTIIGKLLPISLNDILSVYSIRLVVRLPLNDIFL